MHSTIMKKDNQMWTGLLYYTKSGRALRFLVFLVFVGS